MQVVLYQVNCRTMFTTAEKAECVLWLAEFKSVKRVQRRFQTDKGRNPPARNSILHWHKQFRETGTVESQQGKAKKSRISDDDIERVRTAFARSPSKSIREAARQLQMPKSTVHDVVHKRLRLRCYKLQLLHAIQPNDRPRRREFAETMLARLDDDDRYLATIAFSDEATFHVCGKVNRHNCRIWGSENPHAVIEYQRDSPKLNVWCCLMKTGVIGPFFFQERTVTGDTYLDMLRNYAVPQLPPETVFQQDGAPPHYANHVRSFLDGMFPDRWIGRGGPTPWPPRSPDMTPLDFFLWGFVKDKVYRTPVTDIVDLRGRIYDAIELVTPEMLSRVWQEIEYRLDIARATNGAHIEMH